MGELGEELRPLATHSSGGLPEPLPDTPRPLACLLSQQAQPSAILLRQFLMK